MTPIENNQRYAADNFQPPWPVNCLYSFDYFIFFKLVALLPEGFRGGNSYGRIFSLMKARKRRLEVISSRRGFIGKLIAVRC